MTEEEVQEEAQEEEAPSEDEESKEEVVEETTPLLDKANKAADNIKTENDRMEKLLDRQEAIMAKERLGGESEAGVVQEEVKETPEDFANKFMGSDENILLPNEK